MKLWSGIPFALAAFICVGCVADREDEDCDYTIETECGDEECSEEFSEEENCDGEEISEPVEAKHIHTKKKRASGWSNPICEEPCEKECWEREICYEPVYYTTQKCIEKQIPIKKKRARFVPKEYAVQRLRYVPEIYTEVIVKNEIEYYYEDDWKVRTEMVCERQCEWVPRSVWKKVAKDPCDLEFETEQDE